MTILSRIQGSRFSAVQRVWVDSVCVILGGGPSLTREQIAIVHEAHTAGRVRCIAVNASYLLAPWADVCYFADTGFWSWHYGGIDIPALDLKAPQVRTLFEAFEGQKCSIKDSGCDILDDRVHMLKNRDYPHHGAGWSNDPQSLVTGRNSLFQAMNMGSLAGVSTELLLGCDGGPNEDGVTHWHGGHPTPTPDDVWAEMRRAFTLAEDGIRKSGLTVLNCSPGSQVNTFPKVPLELALERMAA